MLSRQRIRANIPKKAIATSSFDKLDPKKQLREAGYPFNHIGTELAELHGKWEIVSSDVRLLKDDFKKQTDVLTTKIGEETNAISKRLDEFHETFFHKVEALFQKKFLWIVGVLIAAFVFMTPVWNYLQDKNVDTFTILVIRFATSIVILVITYLVAQRLK